MANHWRRFVSHRRTELADQGEQEDGSELSALRNIEAANAFIDRLKASSDSELDNGGQERLQTLLIAQTPRAVRAQIQMDRHKHGYHHREKRLYELIDFNDTFVSLVLATPSSHLPGLAKRLYSEMAHFCRRLKTSMFTREQFDAIVRGLSREIAVFRAAREQGFDVHMTSRVEDAFGIDMVITDPKTGLILNIDCKTPPAFRHRLEELLHDGRITEEQLLKADERDFITVLQRRNDKQVPVTLLCIRPDTLGEINDFTFDEPARLTTLFDRVFQTVV